MLALYFSSNIFLAAGDGFLKRKLLLELLLELVWSQFRDLLL
jgi:hypothetical protein